MTSVLELGVATARLAQGDRAGARAAVELAQREAKQPRDFDDIAAWEREHP